MVSEEFENWLRQDSVKKRLQPIREMQKVLLEMLCAFDETCTKHNLQYYLFYGTLLGAIRHQGFIPWDDDVDVVMPREDYQKLLTIAGKTGRGEGIPAGYFLQSPNSEKFSRLAFSKFRKDDTVCITSQDKDMDIHHGMWIDIFPLDNMNSDKASAVLWYGIRFFDLLARFSIVKLVGWKKLLTPLQLIWKMFFTPSFWARVGNKFTVAMSHGNKKYLSSFATWRTKRDREGYLKDMFYPAKKVLFEGKQLSVPAQSEKVLCTLYGDWQRLPSENNRLPTHTSC